MDNFIAITGADLSSKYLSYLPITAAAWHKFSNTKLVCGVAGGEELQEVYRFLGRYCEVIQIEPLIGVDPRIQAKINRMWLAQLPRFEEKAITLVDLDMVPLSDLRNQILRSQDLKYFVKWGYDHHAYSDLREVGKWPMDGTTSRGSIFQELVNPKRMTFQNLVNSWNRETKDLRANPFNTPSNFSDESLLKEITSSSSKQIMAKHLSRNLVEVDYLGGRLDRGKKSPIFPNRALREKQIFEFHGPTPFPSDSRFGKALLRHVGINPHEYLEYQHGLIALIGS